jgi:hypothetical protein
LGDFCACAAASTVQTPTTTTTRYTFMGLEEALGNQWSYFIAFVIVVEAAQTLYGKYFGRTEDEYQTLLGTVVNIIKAKWRKQQEMESRS